MISGNRGVLPVLLLGSLVLAAVGGGILMIGLPGSAQAEDTPAGGTILNATQDRYTQADSVVTKATVSVERTTTDHAVQANVSAVVTDDGQYRLALTGPNRTVTVGSDGTQRWLNSPAIGGAVIIANDSVRFQPSSIAAIPTAQSSLLPDWNQSMIPAAGTEPWPLNGSHAENGTSMAWPQALSTFFQNLTTDARANSSDWNRTPWNDTVAPAVPSNSTNPSDWKLMPAPDGAFNITSTATTVDGTAAYRVTMMPTTATGSASSVQIQIWVTEDWELLQQTITGQNVTVTVDVTETQFNLSTVAPSTFTPPTANQFPSFGDGQSVASIEELRSAVPFEITTIPSSTGYAFSTGTVSQTSLGTIGTATYTDGTSTVVVSQAETIPFSPDGGEQITFRNRTAMQTTVNGQPTIWWETNGTTTILTGGESLAVLRDVAAAARP